MCACACLLADPPDGFRSGSVVAYDVQDHTPPTMAQFVEFLNRAAAAATRGRLLAVHCRGGKGRTGSMCCAWLVYVREASDADDALALFALERTELALGRRKLQGVDTPSQRRYVHQVCALLRSQGAFYSRAGGAATAETSGTASDGAAAAADGPVPVQLPPRPVLALRDFELRDWFVQLPTGPLVCAVHCELPHRPGPCFVTHWSPPVVVDGGGAGAARILFRLDGVQVAGDVRVSVFSLSKLLAARREREKYGEDPRLSFDHAPSGPWESSGGGAPASVSPLASERQQHLDARWTMAGKEPGCLFYFILHTGFVGAAQQVHVPLHMMDQACKNKKGHYHAQGQSTLTFATMAEANVSVGSVDAVAAAAGGAGAVAASAGAVVASARV